MLRLLGERGRERETERQREFHSCCFTILCAFVLVYDNEESVSIMNDIVSTGGMLITVLVYISNNYCML